MTNDVDHCGGSSDLGGKEDNSRPQTWSKKRSSKKYGAEENKRSTSN